MKMFVLWILLCGAVGWGESIESKKPLYEAGLKSAWLLANLFEYMLPQDQQVLPDLSITKVLYTPPYNKNVKLIRTAKEHTPVRIPYLFQGVTVNGSEGTYAKGNWLCTVYVDEHFYDGEYLYLYPWNSNVNCEPDEEEGPDPSGPPPQKPPAPPTTAPKGGPIKAPPDAKPQPPKKQVSDKPQPPKKQVSDKPQPPKKQVSDKPQPPKKQVSDKPQPPKIQVTATPAPKKTSR